jgi:hypothetical protein
LDVRGGYELQIRLLGPPLKSQGIALLKLENYRARISMKGQKYKKNGAEYMKFDNFKIKIYTGRVRMMKLSNLFNGQKALEDAANALFAENSDFMLATVYPSLEKNLGEYFTKIANRICEEATFDELFPEN